MNKDNLNLSKIETYLDSILNKVVSENTYFTTYPDVSIIQSSSWQDMVLVDIPDGIKDFEAYGQGHVFICLYARPLESGAKNVPMMSELENKLNDAIAKAPIKDYYLVRDDAHTTFDDDIRWHCNVYTFILTIV